MDHEKCKLLRSLNALSYLDLWLLGFSFQTSFSIGFGDLEGSLCGFCSLNPKSLNP